MVSVIDTNTVHHSSPVEGSLDTRHLSTVQLLTMLPLVKFPFQLVASTYEMEVKHKSHMNIVAQLTNDLDPHGT